MRAAAIDATLAELAERGYPALSLESVARRAEIHKTTLYRRWGTRENLVLEAMLDRAGERIAVPDTGSLQAETCTSWHGPRPQTRPRPEVGRDGPRRRGRFTS